MLGATTTPPEGDVENDSVIDELNQIAARDSRQKAEREIGKVVEPERITLVRDGAALEAHASLMVICSE
jgi:hypothetical protein